MSIAIDQPVFRVGDRVINSANKHSVVTVHEERTVPAVPGPGGRDAAQLVRVAGSCTWYDAVTGIGYRDKRLALAPFES